MTVYLEPTTDLIVLQVVLDAVVDVGYLGDVEALVAHAKVLLQFAPTARHQLPRLAVVQHPADASLHNAKRLRWR